MPKKKITPRNPASTHRDKLKRSVASARDRADLRRLMDVNQVMKQLTTGKKTKKTNY